MDHFSQNVLFWGCNIFFLSFTYPVNLILSLLVCIKKVHVFGDLFYPLSSCYFNNWNSVFFPFLQPTLLRRQSPSTRLCSLSVLTPWKSEVKQIKINKEKLSQSCIFYPTATDPDLTIGLKCCKNYFFGILLRFFIW